MKRSYAIACARAVGAHIGHQRDLLVVASRSEAMPAACLTSEWAPSAATTRRARSVTSAGCCARRRALHCQRRRVGPQLHRAHARRAASSSMPPRCAQRLPQHVPRCRLLTGVAEGIELVLRGVQAREAEVAGIGDVDLADRRGVRGDRVPHAEGLEDAPRAVAERGGALIEARLRVALRRAPPRSAPPCAAAPASASARLAPTMPPPTIGDIAVLVARCAAHAAAISASISSGSFGTPPVSTSQPLRVTTTSSSMRTPMFQKRLRHRARAGRDVDARLDRQHHARLEHPPLVARPCSRRHRARPCRASGRCDA